MPGEWMRPCYCGLVHVLVIGCWITWVGFYYLYSYCYSSEDDKKKEDKKPDETKDVAKDGGDEKKKGNPTIFPADSPEIGEDCEKLHSAMHGRGTDESAIIELLTDRSNAQRQEIKKKYKEKYVKDLDAELKSELSGDFRELVMAMMTDPAEYDVQELNEAMSGFGTNEDTLIGILTTRSSSELNVIKEKYKSAHKKSLEDVIKKKNSGDFRDILLELCKGQKPDDDKVDKKKAEEDAKALHKCGKTIKPNNDTLKSLMTKNNGSQIKETFEEYKKVSGNDLTDVIEKSCKGDVKDLYLTLAKGSGGTSTLFAERLQKSFKGLGTNDDMLMRICVTRSEIDLADIRDKYKEIYGKELKKEIISETSGDYQKLLLAIIGEREKKSPKKSPQKEKSSKKVQIKDDETIEKKKTEKTESQKSPPKPISAKKQTEEKSQKSSVAKEKNADARGRENNKQDEKRGKSQERSRTPRANDKNKDDKREKSRERSKSGVSREPTIVQARPPPHRDPTYEKKSSPRRENSMYKSRSEAPKDEKPIEKEKYEKVSSEKEKKEKPKDEKKDDKMADEKEDNKNETKDEKSKDDSKKKEDKNKDDSNEDWDKLYKAMKGFGTDEDTIIDVIARNNNSKRQNIREKYQEKYKQNCIDDLKSDLSGDFRKLAVGLMLEPEEHDAYCLHEAVSGKGNKEETLIDIILTKSPKDLEKVKEKYKADYKNDLASDVKKKTKGDVCDVLANALSESKPSDDKVDDGQAEKDARKIYKDKKNPINIKDKTFKDVVMTNNSKQQKKVFDKYSELSGVTIEEAVESSYKGDQKLLYQTLLNSDKDQQAHCADRLNDAFQGMGTNEDVLTRIVASRNEVDLPAVNGKLEENHGKNLIKEIKSETSGDYRKLLLAVIGDKIKEKDVKKKEKSPSKEKEKPQEKSSPSAAPAAVAVVKEDKKEAEKGKTEEQKAKQKDETPKKSDKKDEAKADKKEEKKPDKTEEKKDEDEGNEDWDRLYRAMKGFGTDEDTIINVIAKNKNSQRQNVREKYQEKYKKNCIDDLNSDLSGDFRNLAVGLMLDPVEYDAHCLHQAVSGKGKKEETIIDVILTKSPEELEKIKEKYKTDYKNDLASDVKKKTKGDVCDVLNNALTGTKPDGKVDDEQAEKDAKKIYKDKKNPINVKDKTFKEVLMKNNPDQQKKVFDKYNELSGVTIEEGVESSYKGEQKLLYQTLLNSNKDPQAHCADRLNDAFQGIGTNEDVLSRIVVSRNENDLPAINTKLEDNHGKNLVKEIKSETSGDYKKLLLAVIGDKIKEKNVKKKEKSPEKEKDKPQEKSSPGPAPTVVAVKEEKRGKSPENKKADDKKEKEKNEDKQKGETPKKVDKQDKAKDEKKEEEKKPDDDSNEDWDRLYRAMKGLGTDEDTVIDVIAKNNNSKRQNVREKYQEKYKKNCIEDLNSDLSGDFKNLAVGLMLDPVEYDAHCLHQAVSGKGKKEETMIDVLLTKSPEEVEKIKERYKADYKNDLASDIKKKTKGDVCDILTNALTGPKPSDDKVDDEQAEKDAKKIYKDKKNLINVKDKTFKEVLMKNNPKQQKKVFEKYTDLSGVTIEEGVESSYKGDQKLLYQTLLNSNKEPQSHCADRLNDAFQGMGTNEDVLSRIVVSRNETDLPSVNTKLEDNHGKNLIKEIKSETSGDYKKLLLAVIGDKIKEKDVKKKEKSPEKEKDKSHEKSSPGPAPTIVAVKEEKRGKSPENKKADDRKEEKEKNEDKQKDESPKKVDQQDKAKEEKKEEEKKQDDDSNEDWDRLYRAMKGLGTDEDTVIDVIAKNNNSKRQNVREKYQEKYKKNCIDDLNSDLSGDFRNLAVGLMLDPVEYDAHCLHQAVSGKGKKEETMIDVILTKSPEELEKIKEKYKADYKNDLTSDVKKKTKGDVCDILTNVLSGSKPDDKVNDEQAEKDAKKIYKDKKNLINVKDKTFKEVFMKNNPKQQNKVFEKYHDLSGVTIEEGVESSYKGDQKLLYQTLLNSNKEPQSHCADRLNDAFQGMGTNEDVLSRIVVSKNETDLPTVNTKLEDNHGKNLIKEIKSETSGDYKKLLLAVIGDKIKEKDVKKKEKSPEKEKDKPLEKSSPGPAPTIVAVKEEKRGKSPESKKADDKKEEKEKNEDKQKDESPKKVDKQDKAKEEKKEEEKKSDDDSNEDWDRLYRAMKGLGTDEDTVIDVIAKNNNSKRQNVREKYQEKYKKNCIDDLNSDLSGDFRNLAVGLMLDPVEYDAHCLHQAVSGKGKKEETMIDVILTKSPEELEKIKEKYKADYKNDLTSDVKKKTKGDVCDILTNALSGSKPDDKVNDEQAEKDAKKIYKDKKNLINVKDKTFKEVFMKNNPKQQNKVFEKYNDLSGVTIEEGVESSYKGDQKLLYQTLLNNNKDPQSHCAYRLNDAFQGMGTNEDVLSRIVVSRNETDLPAVNTKLEDNHGKNLIKEVKSEISGDYKKLLLAVIGDKVKEKDVKKKEKSPEKEKDKPHEKSSPGPAPTVAAVKEEKLGKSPESKKADDKKEEKEKNEDKQKGETPKKVDKQDKAKEEKKEEEKKPDDDSNEDWDRLYKAMKGFGTDEDTVIDVIAKNNNSKRQNVRDKYQEKYKKNCIDDLNSDLSGDFRNLAVGLMLDPVEYDAHCLHQAVSGKGKKEETMIDVILTKSPKELEKIKEKYKADYKNDLTSDVKKKTKGDVCDILTNALSGSKPDDKVNDEQAEKDAKKIYKDKKNLINVKDKTFKEVLMKNNSEQQKKVFEKYQELSDVTIEEGVESSYKGDQKLLYQTLLNSNNDPQAHCADRLNEAFKGMGTNEDLLSRIVVSKVENDLPAINTKLEDNHGKNLIKEIKSETSGDYKKLLLAVIDDRIEEKDAKKKEKSPEKKKDEPQETSSPKPVPVIVPIKEGQRSKSPVNKKAENEKEKKEDKQKDTTPKKDDKKESKEEKKEEEKKPDDDSNEDWDRLYRAMKGLGTDEDTVIDVIAKNNNSKRQNVREKYQEKYKKNAIEDLKSELSGDFKNLTVGLMLEPDEYAAHRLHEAVSGKGKKEETMVDILLTKSPEEIDKVKDRYKKDYNKDLITDVKKKTKGEFGDIISDIVSGVTPSDNKVNEEQAEKDAKKIYKDKKNPINTKDKTFKEVLLNNSPDQRKKVFEKYTELSGIGIQEAVNTSYKKELKDAYLSLLNFNEDKEASYADKLNDSFEGFGTNEDRLSTVVITRVEEDLPAINDKLEENHGKNLIKQIKSETSGDYKKLLLAVIGDKVPERDAKKKEKSSAEEDKSQARSSPAPAAAAVIAKDRDHSASPDRGKAKDDKNKKDGESRDAEKSKDESPKKDKKDEKDESNEDWDKLYKAMKGFGTDEDTIIDVIARNNNSQRQNIREKYQEKYKKNSIDDLKSELSGDFRTLAVGLMLDPEEYDAHCLHEAVAGKGKKEEMMTNVILTKSPQELEKVKERYKKDYSQDLSTDIKKKTKGEFNDILVAVLNEEKTSDDKTNEDQAEKDAKQIYKDKKNLINTKDKIFREVLLRNNDKQKKLVFDKYKEVSGVDIEEGVKSSYKGELRDTYITLLKHNEDPQTHYANLLNECFVGRGTNEDMLTRIVVSTAENDLPGIASKYQQLHEKNLVKEIEKETSGDYRKLLLAVVKEKVGATSTDKSSDEKNADSNEDWDKLYRAMKGFGTDEDAIIDVIARNNKDQRQHIREKYKEKYKQDCMDDLKSELSGDFRKLSLGLMMNPTEYYSHCLHSAFKGPGTNEDSIIDILCTKSEQEIGDIKKKYKEDYKKDLESEVKKETSGDFKELLLSILKGGRATGDSVDESKAESAARKIYKDDKCLINPKDHTFKDVMVKENPAQIREVFEFYNKVAGVSIHEAINKSFSSETKDAYSAMAKSIEEGSNHTASNLVESVKEFGTNDDMLIRTVVSRSEVDLGDILSRYEDIANKSLLNEVQSSAKGDDYKKLLTRIIESNQSSGNEKEKNFPEPECDQLYDAMKGLGTDEATVIDVLTKRTNEERQQIKTKYKEKYKKELSSHIKSEMSGDLEAIIQALLMKPVDFDCYCLNKSVNNLEKQQALFLGIVCTRSSKEMNEIKKAYKEAYKKDLADDVKKNSKGETNKLIMDLVNVERENGDNVNDEKSEELAEKLQKNPNCDTYRELFTKYNAAQTRATFREYITASGTGIFTGIDDVIPADAKEAYKSIAKIMEDPTSFYAECLYNVFSGIGTNEDFLTNIIVSRSEIDLPVISSKYGEYFERQLHDEIADETSGDYKKTLLKLLDRFV